MNSGDIVNFHFIPEHACDGTDCRCHETEMVTRDALVAKVWPEELDADGNVLPQALGLHVKFTADELRWAASYQAHSPHATDPPQSGSWTPKPSR